MPDLSLPIAETARGIRADSFDLPLFLHVLGALAMVGAVATAAYYLFRARRDASPSLARNGYLALLFGAIPSYLVMRIAAQWLASEEGLEDSGLAWIDIGFIVSDAGLLILIASTVLAAVAARRAEGTIGRGPAVAGYLLAALLIAYTVTVWAMTTKPA